MQKERENIMLCYPATEKRLKTYKENFFAQPKLKGNRCRVEWFHGEPVLISSYGNIFEGLDHIQEPLKKAGYTVPFDCEIYKHGWHESVISGLCRRKKNMTEKAEDLEIWIFDIQDTEHLQWERVNMLATIFAEGKFNNTPIKFVPTEIITIKQWEAFCAKQIKLGFEGAIYRNPFGRYKNVRSPDICKFKPTALDNYFILDVKEAISKTGELKNMVGAFLVCSDTNQTAFYVGAGSLDHEERKEIWKEHKAGNVIGKYLRVKHELLKTTGGIPICAVALEIVENNKQPH